MKNTMLKNSVMMGAWLLASGYVNTVSAHEQGGTLGKAADAVDYYQISCFDDGNGAADHLTVAVMDMKPVQAATVSVQVYKGNFAKSSSDLIDADAAYSKEVDLKGGNGSYYVLIDKTKANPEVYSLEYHCVTATNEHTGTSISIQQNQ